LVISDFLRLGLSDLPATFSEILIAGTRIFDLTGNSAGSNLLETGVEVRSSLKRASCLNECSLS
jgi:hypothetical protein